MNFIRNFSIKNKLILLILLVSIVSIVIGFSIVILKDIIQLRKDLISDTRLYAALVGEYCVAPMAFGDDSGTAGVLEKLRASPTIENGKLYSSKNTLLSSYDKGNKPFNPPPPDKPEYFQYKENYLHVVHPINFEGQFYGTIYLRASTELLRQTTRTRIFSLLLVMTGIIMLSYLLALRFQRIISKPILKLAGTTEKIAAETDYSIRVQSPGKDEIGTLYDGFNNMLERIELWKRKRDEAEAEQHRLMGELELKNKELEQVVYVTSHDLRSPLVNIQGFGQELNFSLKEIEGLIEKIPVDNEGLKDEITSILREDVLESLKYIHSSTVKMDALLSGLLKLSRVGRMSTTFETVDMNYLITEVTNAFEFHLKEVQAFLHVQPELPPCFGSEMEINQVFSNLVGNAIKYRNPEKKLEIHISGETDVDNTRVLYRVKDNGLGIPKDYQQKIFEIFHRLKPEDNEGEGLGLAIVNKIIQRHKGKVEVDSIPGEGSTFTIYLSPAL